ncbi:winged helix DNA-binding domain-containing protein [Stackebrandtia albiflava]
MPVMTPLITDRVLNRTTLHRQLLTHRLPLTVPEALRRLLGVQAQESNAPYLGLWTRLSGFRLDDLTAAREAREAVRGSTLRGTQHVHAADDYPWLRPLVAPVLLRGRQSAFGTRTVGLDLDELARRGAQLLSGRTMTRSRLRDELAPHFPGVPPEALGWSAQAVLAVVHPPPNGCWRRGGATPFALAEEYLGTPMHDRPDPARLVRRYLAAFGPATVADMQSFSGVRGLSEVVDGMGLRRYRGASGAELFDLPDAPLADADTPAPVRLLPDFDNLMVAYADRRRVMSDAVRAKVCVGAMIAATVLVDGRVRASWTIRLRRDEAVLEITPLEPLSRTDRDAVHAEAAALLEFAAPDVDGRRLHFHD